MLTELFDEELINLKFNDFKDEIDKKHTDIKSSRINSFLQGREFQPHSKRHAKEVIKIELERIEELSNKLYNIYLDQIKKNELEINNNVKAHIIEKVKQIVENERLAFKENAEHFVKSKGDKFIQENFDDKCNKIIAQITRKLEIKQKEQQKVEEKKQKTEENTFKFISDPILRSIITRDYIELDKLLKIKAEKSILLMCGSIIEALLCDLIKDKNPPDKTRGKHDDKNNLLPVEEWDLSHLLNVSKDNKLINQTTFSECFKIADYRNLIHPGKELREKRKIKQGDPDIAKGALENLIEYLRINM